MYKLSFNNEIKIIKDTRVLFNCVTKRGVNYSSILEQHLNDLLNVQDISTAKNVDELAKLIILKELLSRGLIVDTSLSSTQEIKHLERLNLFEMVGNSLFKITKLHHQYLPDYKHIALFGVVSDIGASRPGSRHGADILRHYSQTFNFRSSKENFIFDLKELKNALSSDVLYDIGNIHYRGESKEEFYSKVEAALECLPVNSLPIMIGGDHSLTYYAVKSIYNKRSNNLTLVQLDHHLDVQIWGKFANNKPEYLFPLIHSNFMSWIKEELPNVKCWQIGVSHYQSISDIDNLNDVINYLSSFSTVITNKELITMSLKQIEEKLPCNQDVYLSIDVDVLCSKFMNNTGYPAPIGMTIAQLFFIVNSIIKNNNILGIDIMEFGASHHIDKHYEEAMLICYIMIDIINGLIKKYKS